MECKFSIIVPVYNAEKYLSECIDSILKQTYPYFELLLIDDGSKDMSGKICDEYSEKDERIKVFHKPNNGQLHTREYGILKASNEWLIFIDSDDYIENFTLQKLNEKINQYECDCIVYGYRKFNSQKILSTSEVLNDELVITDKRNLFKKFLLCAEYNSMWRKAVKKNCFKGKDYSEYYHLRISEDRLHSAEVFENASKIVFIDDIFYNYRDNEFGVINNIKPEMITDFIVEEHLLNMVKDNNFFNEEDFKDYRVTMIKRIITAICVITIAEKTKEEKIVFLNKIKNSGFYKNFVLNGKFSRLKIGKKYVLFLLFRLGLYDIVFGLERLYNSIKR